MISYRQNTLISKVDPIVGYAALLVSSYLVGIICIGFGVLPGLVEFTGLNLMLTFILLVLNQQGDKRKVMWFAGLAYVIGFFAEIIGVQSGVLFGDYSYGRVLGPKLFGTPFLIGVNWTILVLSVGVLLNTHTKELSPVVKSTIGALVLTGIDFLIEPVATKLEMWTWIDNAVPAQNYVGWFLVSFTMFMLFFRLKINGGNRLAGLSIALIVVFFATLNLCLDTDVDIFVSEFSFL